MPSAPDDQPTAPAEGGDCKCWDTIKCPDGVASCAPAADGTGETARKEVHLGQVAPRRRSADSLARPGGEASLADPTPAPDLITLTRGQYETALREAKAGAWDEAVQALSWCLIERRTHPDVGLPYVAEHNPYRDRIEGES